MVSNDKKSDGKRRKNLSISRKIIPLILTNQIIQISTQSPPNTTHFINCTINGVIHYDLDCTNEFTHFFLWMGLGLSLLVMMVFCCLAYCIATMCRELCCGSEDDRPRMIARNIKNYSSISP